MYLIILSVKSFNISTGNSNNNINLMVVHVDDIDDLTVYNEYF
jgi:hypothetical protein